MSKLRVAVIGVAALLVAGGLAAWLVPGGAKPVALRTESAAGVDAVGVGPVSAVEFENRGIYLGPPGSVPSAATGIQPQQATPTSVSSPGVASTSVPSGEAAAVAGDPANGTASITASQATATAISQSTGFVGDVTSGTPVLVQYDDAYAGVIGTAWAVPLTGIVQLSRGPNPLPGSTTSTTAPSAQTVIVFIDAVTGNLISEEGFSNPAS